MTVARVEMSGVPEPVKKCVTLLKNAKSDTEKFAALFMVAEILNEKYNVKTEIALEVCTKFLGYFRAMPHNTDVSLDQWRIYLWKKALSKNGLSNLAEKIYKEWLLLRYNCLSLTPQVKSLLNKLHDKYSLALITNGTSEFQWEKIRSLDVEQYFHCILVSGDLPWDKPNPNIYLYACELLKMKAENCMMVGDKLETDILGAISAGLSITVLVSGNLEKSCIANEYIVPDYTIQNISQLAQLLSL